MLQGTSVSRGDQNRALALSTIAFTACFAVWTIFSIIGVAIKKELSLSEFQFGLLVATPILTGSLTRLFLGVWTEKYGGRLVFALQMILAGMATWALTWAHTYPMYLVAALGVGLAGGSFIIGVAYVSRWYDMGKQGTALGIFGAGNVGAAVTKFVAPFVMVAYGWQGVAQTWAVGLMAIGVLFFLLAKDDPELVARRARGVRAPSLAQQFAPLANLQVWRFSLYYFFVFGAFVALALWMPHYLIDVYGIDVKTAGMSAAMFSLSASVFRAYGGHLSDKFGARSVMYWTFGFSLLFLFMLSYPPTDYVIQGKDGPIHFQTAMGLWPFVAILFALGFFMSLGKAAVFKHIPVYYPNHVGAVGGLVGMIGGLGGFILPIVFGALLDVTGIYTSCFALLFLLVGIALTWMHMSIRAMERAAHGEALDKLPSAARDAGDPHPRQDRHAAHACGLAARGSDVLAILGPRRCAQEPVAVDPGTLAGLLGLDGLVDGGGEAAVHRLCLHARPAFLAGGSPGALRRDAQDLLQLHGADLRRQALDDALDCIASDPGDRHRLCGAEP